MLTSLTTLPIPTWLRTTFVPFNPLPKLDTKVTTGDTKFMICAVVKDEELYIDEWLEYHKFLGFDYVMLHENADNMSTYMTELPKKYPEYVTINHGPGLYQQDVNCQKCINTFQNTSMWAAFIDVDEFVVLHKHKNIREYVQDVAPFGGSIAINRAHFTSSNHQNYSAYPVLYRFQARHVRVDIRVKSIAYVPHINTTQTHHMQLYGNLPILDAAGRVARADCLYSSGLLNGSIEVAAINHYFTKSFAEFKKKRLRGLAGHSEWNSLYQGKEGAMKIMREFWRSDHPKNITIDTFSWDWYRAKKSEQLGYAYGAHFPVLNFTAALVPTVVPVSSKVSRQKKKQGTVVASTLDLPTRGNRRSPK